MKKLTEGTLVPLSLVGVFIAASISVGVLYQKVEANEGKILQHDSFVREVIDRLARVETKLDEILKTK